MTHPGDPLILIKFFLKKREEVEDWETPFTFTFEEAREEQVPVSNQNELIALISRLSHQHFNSERFGVEKPVLGSYIVGEDGKTITILNTTTEGLKAHQDFIRKKMTLSLLTLVLADNYYAANVEYLGQRTKEPVRKGAFLALEMLVKNFRNPTTYDMLIERFNQVSSIKKEFEEGGKPVNRKTVQYAVLGAFRRLEKEIGVPPGILITHRNEGYSLYF